MNASKKRGIAALPTVIVIGLIILATVASVAAIAFNELLISEGSAQSATALAYAESGARDALVRIARDRTYECSTEDCYSVDFVANGCSADSDCAWVSVSSGIGTTADPKIITSKGIMKSSTRRLEVSVVLDNGTETVSDQHGEITSTTWTELTN